jgi:hypothetical protein
MQQGSFRYISRETHFETVCQWHFTLALGRNKQVLL